MKAELYILGVLHRGDFHPYEIKRRMTQAMIECFTDVDVGTLYYAVRQLADAGMLAAVAHERVARAACALSTALLHVGGNAFVNYCTSNLQPKATFDRLFMVPCSFCILPTLA